MGAAERDELIDPVNVTAGDVLVGIASSGIHSNGFSLVRKIFPMNERNLMRHVDELGMNLGEALLTPTRIYVRALKALKDKGINIHGCSHITGGGFYENIPRMLPEGARARVNRSSYTVPPIFKLLQKEGNVEDEMMYNTYNMGVGMVLAVDENDANAVIDTLKAAGESAFVIGDIVSGEKGTDINE